MINKNYANLKESYLFTEIGRRVKAYTEANPDKKVIKMGIGDVTKPLCKAVTDAMNKAVIEMSTKEGFHGYGPEQGYDFLRNAVADYYKNFGVALKSDEIFISDGAKSDLGNILDLFDKDCKVLVQDPVYPVYVDTNIMDGRKILYADAVEENGYLPMPSDACDADIIYICSPNNPCGAAYTRDMLEEWVSYANSRGAVILFDSAYEAFIEDAQVPHSIYEISGAETCAIEFCSLSKTAGFTGTRCGYTIVPEALVRDGFELRKLWLRRQTTKFNGVSYVVQRGAEAVFSAEGQKQIKEQIRYYKNNAAIIASTFDELGISYTGGVNSPYIWLDCKCDSWEFFDKLLNEIQVVGTPGAGFGKNGEHHFRLTSFSTLENTTEAMERFKKLKL